MKHNPWGDLIKIIDKRIRKAMPQLGDLGTVISIDPLKVEFNGVVVDSDIFYLDIISKQYQTGDI